MMNKMLFSEGTIVTGTWDKELESIPWNPHPSFRGVSMKNLICGGDTCGRLSCHLVKIEPGCMIGRHMHQGKMELHEVIYGEGKCYAGDRVLSYSPGVVSCIDDDIYHKVEAGDEGLYILAKFTPALM